MPKIKRTNTAPVGFFKGFEGVYTGKSKELHGGRFYEIRMTEGPDKGKIKLIVNGPKGERDKVFDPPRQNRPRTPQIRGAFRP